MPIATWGSEYSANFMSPLDFVYERGAWKGASHPEFFMKADGSSPEREPSAPSQLSQPQQQSISTSVSWFDQLIELHQRADEYRTRAQRVHFPPYHLSIHHHDNADQDSFVTTSSMTSSSPSDDQTPIETSSPTSDSTEGIHVSRDFVDQTQSRHLSQNQGRLGCGKSQKTYQVAQVFSKTTASLGKRVGGDRGHKRMIVEDMEESWDSETLIDDGSLSQDGTKPRSSTPPQESHLKTHGAAETSKFREPSVEVGRLKIIPRPNAFSLGGDGEIEGRVPTPELRKSVPGQQSRHHLDTTTPSGGGLLISPSKPEMRGGRDVVKSVELPYPPVSPKYRRDMKSKAPIYPPP